MRTPGFVTALLAVCLAGCATEPALAPASLVPTLLETPPVGAAGDAADDPAIFLSENPALTRVIGTQKQGGLYVYDRAGAITQELPGGRPNNVDLRDGFAWPEGEGVIVATSDRADNAVVLYHFDPASGRLDPTPRARIPTGWVEVYGVCLGRVEGALVALATSKVGEVSVFSLEHGPAAPVFARTIGFDLGSIAEGCVIDDVSGVAYISEETVGLWRVDLRDPGSRRLVDRVGDGRIVGDVEGAAIARTAAGGYLIVSSQAANRFAVYELTGENRYRGAFTLTDGGADRVSHTDGIDVAVGPDGEGLFVAQDDENTGPNSAQNFKYATWSAIAAALGLE